MSLPSPESVPDSPEIDARLAARRVAPSAGFADRVLARLEAGETAPEPALDSRLAARPVSVGADFTDRVLVGIEAERRRRRFTLRVAYPAAVAACAALVALVAARPADNADTRLARLLASDAELRSLSTLTPGTQTAAHTVENDLAVLTEFDAAVSEITADTVS